MDTTAQKISNQNILNTFVRSDITLDSFENDLWRYGKDEQNYINPLDLYFSFEDDVPLSVRKLVISFKTDRTTERQDIREVMIEYLTVMPKPGPTTSEILIKFLNEAELEIQDPKLLSAVLKAIEYSKIVAITTRRHKDDN